MDYEKKPTWEGGLWEQKNPQQPTPPPVVVPVRVEESVEEEPPVSKKAKVGFAGLVTLIFAAVCLSIALGYRNQQGTDSGSLPNIFDYGATEIDPLEGTNLPPTIRKAAWDENVHLTLYDGYGHSLTPQEIYAQNLPTIVYIEVQGFGKVSTGTGVIMTEDGYIITNAHVIDSASSAQVTLWNNESYDAKLIGYNFAEDLAVLKIDAEDLTPAEFGDSDDLHVGEPSYALGNPLGAKYRSTFTDGMVSAVDRVLEVDNNNLVLIQTTTAINSGNSGGALLNQYGQVVGITTIKIMSEQDTIEGMGFAIPSKRVKQVVDHLISGRELVTATIGIRVEQVSSPIVGVRVGAFTFDESNIEDSGMKKGDIIIEANGKKVESIDDLTLAKYYLYPGDVIDYVVYRNGEELSFSSVLEESE